MNIRKVSVAFTLLALIGLWAPTAEAKKSYGKGLTNAEVVDLDTLMKSPEKWVGRKIQVSGLVTDVCPKRGCWIKIGSKNMNTLRFKVRDGVMVFPMQARGKKATVEGILTRIELSKKQAEARARHIAEEKGQPFDPKTVSKAAVIYQLKGEGAVVQ